MLDEKDIQIIAQLLAQQKNEIMQEIDQKMDEKMDVRFARQKREIMHEVRLLMENYFDPKFNALSDGMELLKETALGREKVEEVSDRLDVLEAVVKVHSREIEKLKMA